MLRDPVSPGAEAPPWVVWGKTVGLRQSGDQTVNTGLASNFRSITWQLFALDKLRKPESRFPHY